MPLQWPPETVLAADADASWQQPLSNIVLDFHGDPLKAGLVVFSDGNHHMALLDAIKKFHRQNPRVEDIFYATTPPAPILKILRDGALRLGNLILSVQPHIFISPPHVLDALQREGYLANHCCLAENRGSVLLVRRGNPKFIASVADLMRAEVSLFISHPCTESVSHAGYRETLVGMAEEAGVDPHRFEEAVFGPTLVVGQSIHHREAPQAVAEGRADAAIVYYHLALRYCRLFPERFDIVPLGGTVEAPDPSPRNRIARIHMGVVGDGGPWGQAFADFMQTPAVAEIYRGHGLRHAADLTGA